jgi:hypothetical protein
LEPSDVSCGQKLNTLIHSIFWWYGPRPSGCLKPKTVPNHIFYVFPIYKHLL